MLSRICRKKLHLNLPAFYHKIWLAHNELVSSLKANYFSFKISCFKHLKKAPIINQPFFPISSLISHPLLNINSYIIGSNNNILAKLRWAYFPPLHGWPWLGPLTFPPSPQRTLCFKPQRNYSPRRRAAIFRSEGKRKLEGGKKAPDDTEDTVINNNKSYYKLSWIKCLPSMVLISLPHNNLPWNKSLFLHVYLPTTVADSKQVQQSACGYAGIMANTAWLCSMVSS